MKRSKPRIPRPPRPSRATVVDLVVTGSFVAGAITSAIAIALVYLPAGLFVVGAGAMAGSAWYARRFG